MIAKLFIIIIGAIFVNNFVLSRFLGICPYLGVSKHWESAMGMGLAVIFVMTMASFITWIIYKFILLPFEDIGAVAVLQTISFILTIAALVQVVEMIMRKTAPALYKALGIYLPLITTNCAVLGVTLLTSIDDQILNEQMLVKVDTSSYIKTMAKRAKESGLDGVVASPKEIKLVRENCGDDFVILTPGIRPAWASKDDQKRLSTPKEAIENGANYLVIGRPIIRAENPLDAFNKIKEEIS